MDSTITPRKFIEVWQTSSAVAQVASKLRMKKASCRVRAYRYRQLGIPLKEFPPVELPIVDWEELAQYAAKLLAGTDGTVPDRGQSA